MIPASAPSAPYTPLKSANNAVAILGDSITANGTYGQTTSLTGRAWYMWAMGLATRRFWIANVAAAGGYRTDQILSNLLPYVIANTGSFTSAAGSTMPRPKPGFCVVLAGTNDVGGIGGTDSNGVTITLASALGYLRQIYTQLLAAGITPIACAIPPRSDIVDNVIRYNLGVAVLAQQLGLPFCDLYMPCANPSTGFWSSGLYDTTSPIHPNQSGALAMGQALAATLNILPAKSLPSLAAQDNNIMWANSLFLTDANADGVPDAWTGNMNTATPSIVSGDAGVIGNAFLVTVTGTGGSYPRSPTLTTSAGNWLAWFGRFSFVPAGTSPQFNIVLKQTFQGVGGYGQTLAGYSIGSEGGSTAPPISTNGYLDFYTIVQTQTNCNGVAVEIDVAGNGSVAKVAQIGIVDLTAMGLAVR